MMGRLNGRVFLQTVRQADAVARHGSITGSFHRYGRGLFLEWVQTIRYLASRRTTEWIRPFHRYRRGLCIEWILHVLFPVRPPGRTVEGVGAVVEWILAPVLWCGVRRRIRLFAGGCARAGGVGPGEQPATKTGVARLARRGRLHHDVLLPLRPEALAIPLEGTLGLAALRLRFLSSSRRRGTIPCLSGFGRALKQSLRGLDLDTVGRVPRPGRSKIELDL